MHHKDNCDYGKHQSTLSEVLRSLNKVARDQLILSVVWKKDVKSANLSLLENKRDVVLERKTEYKVKAGNITL